MKAVSIAKSAKRRTNKKADTGEASCQHVNDLFEIAMRSLASSQAKIVRIEATLADVIQRTEALRDAINRSAYGDPSVIVEVEE